MVHLVVFIIFVFTCYSLVNMLIYFDGPFNIFRHIRTILTKLGENAAQLVRCEACCSTWVGFMLSVINILLFPTIPFTPFNLILGDFYKDLWFLIILLDGICGSGTTWMTFKIENFLVGNTPTEEEEA